MNVIISASSTLSAPSLICNRAGVELHNGRRAVLCAPTNCRAGGLRRADGNDGARGTGGLEGHHSPSSMACGRKFASGSPLAAPPQCTDAGAGKVADARAGGVGRTSRCAAAAARQLHSSLGLGPGFTDEATGFTDEAAGARSSS